MYGDFVHRAVIDNHEEESGITIHFVNDVYDAGEIIFQTRIRVEPDDTPESLALKIHSLEYEHYPRVIEETINKLP
jgi:phosphoribosylglycinamide formyltransferase 1